MEIVTSRTNEINFVDTDASTLVDSLVNGYETITGRKLQKADPTRIFILWVSNILIQERVKMNESARKNLPRYAEGEVLDELCALFHNVRRMEATRAETVLKFTLSTTLEEDYVISKPLTVTVDGSVNFTTKDSIIFKTGELTALVRAECETAGTVGNDYIAGQINKLISDEFLYFQSVENITNSSGGTDKETDKELYKRMRESEETISTAGGIGYYKYLALSASTDIADVATTSPSPGVVDIRIIMDNGKMPTSEDIQLLKNAIGDDKRVFTDNLQISAPDALSYDIDLTYYIQSDKTEGTQEIQEKVNDAIENYIKWQCGKIGRDVNPSYLLSLLMAAGIKRAEITNPVYQAVGSTQVAIAGSITKTFGGLEDE